MVTSDSLAAESIQEGGSFAANADNRGPMAQPSRSVNTNTTDTSNATRLAPAPDAEARQVSEEWNETAALNTGLGSNSNQSGGGSAWYTSSDSTGGVADQTNREQSTTGDSFKPKGQNITEGGFDSDAPNASFNTDIGGKDDPGRLGLNQIQEENTPFAGGAGPRETQISGSKQFGDLEETES